jgi:hypothetical protein
MSSLRQRRPRKKDAAYLAFIRRLPSLVSGQDGCEACHVRYGSPAHGKRHTGMAERPDDRWSVPLTPYEHRLGNDSQHSTNERKWWAAHGIDPLAVAGLLYASYQAGEDEQIARQICLSAREIGVLQK